MAGRAKYKSNNKFWGNMRASVLLVIASASLAGGCASIVGGTTQVVSVETQQNLQRVEGARCELVNDKGTYHVSTPGTTSVSRAYGDLTVKCEKEGMPAGTATVTSTTKGLVFGNALFGGLIGVAVDTSSGAAYDYPELIRISMGQDIAINGRDRMDEPAPAPATTTLAAAPGAPATPASPGAMPAATSAPGTPVSPTAATTAQKPVSMDDLRYLLPPR